MSLPNVVTRAEWLVARKALLEKEKAITRQQDALSEARRNLPMVKIEKDYVFESERGQVRLINLFEGRPQLIIYHFLFGPMWEKGCHRCTAMWDESGDGRFRHLHNRDTTLAVVSRAPLEKISSYKATRGWTFPWYSSYGSDFNYDFHVTVDERVKPPEYNFSTKSEHEKAGTGYWFEGEPPLEMPGFSCFIQDANSVFHTYSTFGRGVEVAHPSFHLLDLTVLGRQEVWERPKGRVERPFPALPFATKRL